jgi:hypothetical protein
VARHIDRNPDRLARYRADGKAREARIRVLRRQQHVGQLTPQGQQDLADLLNRPGPQNARNKRKKSQPTENQPQARVPKKNPDLASTNKANTIGKGMVSDLLINARLVAVKSVPPARKITRRTFAPSEQLKPWSTSGD